MDGSQTTQFPGGTVAAYWILYVGRMSNTTALTVLIYEKCGQIDLVWRKRESWITNSWIAPLWIAFQLTIVALTGTSATAVKIATFHPPNQELNPCFLDLTLLMALSVRAPDEFRQPRRDVDWFLMILYTPARPWSPY
ncbi:hypothetical protein EDD17DRAFT_1635758 [Pisolithus thermaeus]|nr:hypothetical protein EDD17DRAFT_1635758 [Pisolithus thermaeus]